MNLSYLAFLRLLIENVNVLPQLTTLVEKMTAASNWLNKWAYIKQIGDILAPLIGRLTGDSISVAQASNAEEEEQFLLTLIHRDPNVCTALALDVEQNDETPEIKAARRRWDPERLRRIFGIVRTILVPLLEMRGEQIDAEEKARQQRLEIAAGAAPGGDPPAATNPTLAPTPTHAPAPGGQHAAPGAEPTPAQPAATTHDPGQAGEPKGPQPPQA